MNKTPAPYSICKFTKTAKHSRSQMAREHFLCKIQEQQKLLILAFLLFV